jgi:predicted nucleic acid-binding protein
MVVLDTSAASAVMHRLPGALERLRRQPPDQVVLSSPVAAEIHYGLSRLPPRARRRQLLEGEYRRLRSVARWADWTEAAAEEFGRQKAALERRGRRLEDMDLAIAALALTLGAAVATLDVRHFSRVDGLTVDDWTPAAPPA